MLKAKSTPYMPTYYHQRTHHKQRKPHAISGGGGPDLSASGSPFFFPLLACIFSLFHWGNKSESNNISTRKAKKHAQIYREFSLQRQSKFWGGGGGGETLTHQETPPGPNSGPNWERKKAAAEARSELCGASGVLGGEGGEDWWVLGEARRGGENSTRFSSLLSSSCLVFSSPRRRRCVWPSAAGCLCQPFYLGLLRYRMTCP